MELAQTHQYPGEDLNTDVKRFHEKPLDCCDRVVKDVLVDIYLHGMI